MAKRRAKTDSNAGLLAQVAHRANVSTGTVSRAFNNSPLIPVETRGRVLDAARELGFRPRVGVRNQQIALITEPPHKTIMGGYVNTLTQYICFALSRANAGISLVTEDRLDDLANVWYDGIIGIAWEERTIQTLRALQAVPIVWLSDNYADRFHTVYFDGRKTGRLAGDYLLDKGHVKLAIVHDGDYTGGERAAGVAEAMAARGFDPRTQLVDIVNAMPLHVAVKQLIDRGATAVWVTGEDMKVLEVSWLLQELAGKRIPRDISLMGFENPGISEFLRPSLTTIACPMRDMAEAAVAMVLDKTASADAPRKQELPVTLIERASVAPPPAAPRSAPVAPDAAILASV